MGKTRLALELASRNREAFEHGAFIVNLAPLLPLDGGHVVIATYERIRSRRGHRYQVDVMKLLPLTYFVILLLGLLFVSTMFLDLVDPIRLN